jgi:hypothetical protein
MADGIDGLTDAERLARTLKRKRTARGIANAKSAAKASVGRIDAATQRTLDRLRERDGEPW